MTRIVDHLLVRLAIGALLIASLQAFAAGVSLHGAGASFPAPLYAKWADDYRRETGVEVVYDAVGSGEGVRRIERADIDFGASDMPLAPADLQRLGAIQFPVAIGGVVPVVNIGGIGSGELKLTGQVLADIYLGTIAKWNDAAIVALNPSLQLPDANITVVHRSDASGTTFLWTEFLARSSAAWREKVGPASMGVGVGARADPASALAWPVGVAAAGNEGVASMVQRTRVSIGYVEYTYAVQHHLQLASLRNREGAFVRADHRSFVEAVASARWSSAADLSQMLIDPPGAGSWPLIGSTFIIVRASSTESGQSAEAIKFFDWALRHGQSAAIDLGYVPVPASAVRLIDGLIGVGNPGSSTPRRLELAIGHPS